MPTAEFSPFAIVKSMPLTFLNAGSFALRNSQPASDTTSPIAKMSSKAAKLTDFALATASDVAIDAGMEYMATGKITLRGVTYAVTFSAAGRSLMVFLTASAAA